MKPPLDEAAYPPARHACASTPDFGEPVTTRHLGLNDHSKSALAQRFVERHADELRFCAAWSKWLRYDGVRWQAEPTLLAFDFAHAICREAAAECTSKSAVGIASAHTVAAITTLARADRRLAAVVDQWDADPWLLNTPGGTVRRTT